METALLIARLLLAGVFLVAGLAKLADRAGSRQAIIDFGVPLALAMPFGVLLPLAEIAIAFALIPGGFISWAGALGALALLLIFIVGISVSLARGRRPKCHCFGQLSSSPASKSTLVRNGLLAAVAALVVWQGYGGDTGPGFFAWMGNLSIVENILVIAMAVMLGLLAIIGKFMVDALAQNGRLLSRVEALEKTLADGGMAPTPVAQTEAPAAPPPGLPVGTPAPTFSLSGLYGETLTLDALRAQGKPVMLIFSDPGCGPCTALLPEASRWQREHAARLTTAVMSRGTPDDNRAKATEHGLGNVLLQSDNEVADAYQAYGTPTAVLINPDGTIASPLAPGAEAINDLVARTLGTPMPTQLSALAPAVPVSGNGHANGAVMPQLAAAAPEPEPMPEGLSVGSPARSQASRPGRQPG